MTKENLKFIKTLLEHVKPNDEHVKKAIAYIDKDLAQYEACRGQLKDQYEHDWPNY